MNPKNAQGEEKVCEILSEDPTSASDSDSESESEESIVFQLMRPELRESLW